MLKRSYEKKHPCLASDLSGKACTFSSLRPLNIFFPYQDNQEGQVFQNQIATRQWCIHRSGSDCVFISGVSGGLSSA